MLKRQPAVLKGNAAARRYAALERQLGEVDRARAILVHASSLADPRVNPQFWADWNEFEVRRAQLPVLCMKTYKKQPRCALVPPSCILYYPRTPFLACQQCALLQKAYLFCCITILLAKGKGST